MRRSVLAVSILGLVILLFLIHSVFTLLQLLVETGEAEAIQRSDIPPVEEKSPSLPPPLIPKIIHQTYKNESIPERWKEPFVQCQDLHKDYTFYLWTDEKSREFIAREYPFFLETFDAYTFPIQRADVIRYFVLAHYGGTYIDLDVGCARRLDPLNSYSTWVHRTSPTGVSNDAMGSVPNHPFWISVIDNLQSYARNWGFPYLTVMYSTGPLFISVIWKQWIAAGGNLNRDHRVRILRVDDYNSGPERFFNTFGGSSWHQGDVAFLGYVVENWFLFIILGSLLGAIGGWLLWGKVVGRKGIFGSRGLRWRGGSHKYRSTKGYGLVDRHEV